MTIPFDPQGLPLTRALNNLAPKSRNFMKQLIYSDCAEPWFVYAETFVPAFLKLFLTINFIDLADLVRWRAGESISEGSRGTRRRGRHMGRRTAHEHPHQKRSYTQRGLRTLYIITAPLELFGLIWLLYSAGDQFFYDWQTLIRRFGKCGDAPEFGPFHRAGFNVPTSITTAGTGFSLPILLQDRAGWGGNAFATALGPGRYSVQLAITVEAGLIDLSSVGCQIVVAGVIVPTIFKSGTERIPVGEPVDLIASGTFTLTGALPLAGVFWEVYGMLSATGVNIVQGDVIITRSL